MQDMIGASIAAAVMVVFGVACQLAPAPMLQVFSSDPHVIAWDGIPPDRLVDVRRVGDHLRASSMLQALGNTMPALISSLTRLLIVVVPLTVLSRTDGFALRWIWYLSAGSIVVPLAMNLVLLHREFRIRLPAPASVAS